MKIDSSLLQSLGITVPEILLPSQAVDPGNWAVIACDQHTSDRSYWKRVEERCSTSPSSLELVFPEVYLEDEDAPRRIKAIHQAMDEYIKQGVLESRGYGWVYVERRTEASGLRQGLVLAVDLEQYDFRPGSTSLIRATEGTIVERIPPRVRVREEAPLELPHVMILIDDRENQIIEPLSSMTDELEPLYSFDLMEDGGSIKGYWIDDPDLINSIAGKLGQLASPEITSARYGSSTPLLFAMGDGNHSLATAKTVWETLKKKHVDSGGAMEDIQDHPARYALAEIVNIYSPGLRFEPIHRVLFTTDFTSFADALAGEAPEAGGLTHLEGETAAKKWLQSNKDGAVVFNNKRWYAFAGSRNELAPATVDRAQKRLENQGSTIDFIHGWEHSKNLAADHSDRIAVFFNVIAREDLFSYVIHHGALPRKAFSMGDAEEKRYYYEARKVR